MMNINAPRLSELTEMKLLITLVAFASGYQLTQSLYFRIKFKLH